VTPKNRRLPRDRVPALWIAARAAAVAVAVADANVRVTVQPPLL
jgi:hypothetical protein